jgi:xanthine dehydrogenase small subunit
LYVDVDAAGRVSLARLAFGGMAATPQRAAAAEAALLGQPWDERSVEAAAQALSRDFTPLSDHRGSKAYRSIVAANLLRGFFEETLHVKQPQLSPAHAATVLSAEEVRGA